ncbi:MAG TPA: ATP-binding protein [Anaerolineae bacterium]|nr:ATP-binding protein [Anaerolineae bacterium]
MTLLQQFLTLGIIPLLLVLMASYLGWYRRPQHTNTKRRHVTYIWGTTLILQAIAASSIMSYFVGTNINPNIAHNWRIWGIHAFALTATGLLFLSTRQHAQPDKREQIILTLSGALNLISIVTNPMIWGLRSGNLNILGQTVQYYTIWGSIWVTSWLIPLGLAWSIRRQAYKNLPSSQFRVQTYYWWIGLTLYFIGGFFFFGRHKDMIIWQELASIIHLVAAALGTFSLTRSPLPDLQPRLWQLRGSAVRLLFLFALTSSTFFFLFSTDFGQQISAVNWRILIAAAAFAFILWLAYLLNQTLSQEQQAEEEDQQLLEHYQSQYIHNFLDVHDVGQFAQAITNLNLKTDDVWLFTTEEGPCGLLILRPLIANKQNGKYPLDTTFNPQSPFTQYMRQAKEPLIYYDVIAVGQFDNLTGAERAALDSWQRVLYMPLRIGQKLVGVLTVGPKESGTNYTDLDLQKMAELAREIAPPLYQTQTLTKLQQINQYIVNQNQHLVYTNQYLTPRLELYNQFMDLISPELRSPLNTIDKSWNLIQQRLEAKRPIRERMTQELDDATISLRSMINNLIAIVPRIQDESAYQRQPLMMDEICREVIHNLHSMSEARRVTVELDTIRQLPLIIGDSTHLQRAIHQILHNAIKFNKIGGKVRVECGVEGNEIYAQISDNGVGMNEARLAKLWTGINDIQHVTQHAGHGVGLGLILAQTIIKAHNGRIAVDSKHGAGSTFTVYIPLAFDNEYDIPPLSAE